MSQVPVDVSRLAAEPAASAPATQIGFKWHARSQHASIENYQPPSYYEDYIMTNSYSDSMQALQKGQMDRLISLHESLKGPASFVEIGCGDGSFMKYARGRIERILGIEPSARFAAEAIREGFQVKVGYVGSATQITDDKFDSFGSRQVFEHLPDPADVLTGIREMLNPGAVGLIEVPNGQRSLRRKRFFDFFPDHVNYYSVNSLVALANDAGFNVIACNEAFGGDYLELWMRYEPEPEKWFTQMVARRASVCSALAEEMAKLSAKGQRVAVWGCGAKTLSILSASSAELLSSIICIIDSDPHKHGRYVPGTSIPVLSPASGADVRPDVIIVLALSYREEIAATIRQRIPSCLSILTLDDNARIASL